MVTALGLSVEVRHECPRKRREIAITCTTNPRVSVGRKGSKNNSKIQYRMKAGKKIQKTNLNDDHALPFDVSC